MGGARAWMVLTALVAGGCAGEVPSSPDASGDDAGSRDGGAANDAGSDAGPPGCTSDGACEDGVDCTDDTCTVSTGACRHAIVPALCPSGSSCHPVRGCEMGRPCASDADCADEDACTVSEHCDAASRTCVVDPLDGDGDGDAPRVCGGGDCDDSMNTVYDGAEERCNTIDDDCDGAVDDGLDASVCTFCRAVNGCGEEDMHGCYTRTNADLATLACTNRAAVTSALAACTMCSTYACREAALETCLCVGGLSVCDGACVDLATNDRHCGGCDDGCAAYSTCRGGSCAPCGTASQSCCPSTTGDPYCMPGAECAGTLCRACGGASQPCCGGETCGGDLLCSSGTCRPCGEPGQPCCAGGACHYREIWTGQNTCVDGTCEGCGRDGEACCVPDPGIRLEDCAGALTCSTSGCGCPGALTACAYDCVDRSTDNYNCGSCGNQCLARRQECVAGACVACGSSGRPCCFGTDCYDGSTCSGGSCS